MFKKWTAKQEAWYRWFFKSGKIFEVQNMTEPRNDLVYAFKAVIKEKK